MVVSHCPSVDPGWLLCLFCLLSKFSSIICSDRNHTDDRHHFHGDNPCQYAPTYCYIYVHDNHCATIYLLVTVDIVSFLEHALPANVPWGAPGHSAYLCVGLACSSFLVQSVPVFVSVFLVYQAADVHDCHNSCRYSRSILLENRQQLVGIQQK